MSKRRSHRRNSGIIRKTMRGISKTASYVVPKVESGLEKIGSKVSFLASRSEPTIKKGLSSMYGIVKTGTETAAKTIRSTLKNRSRSRSRTARRTRSRSRSRSRR